MYETVVLQTKDGVTIAGDFYKADSSVAALLIHMMPATKESWRPFAEDLLQAGVAAFAIDLRGHGASQGGPDGYKNFTEADHQKSIHDVEMGVELLHSHGYQTIFLIGASIGANLALQYAATHADIKKVIALSAGINYRGVVTPPFVEALSEDQGVYFVGDEDDWRSSGDSAAEMARILYDIKKGKKYLEPMKGSGHGTDMLLKHPDFSNRLIEWLRVK